MECEESKIRHCEMVIKAEYSRIKSECNLEEEVQIEYEPVIKQEPPDDVNPEVEQEYDTGECENKASDYVNNGKTSKPCTEKSESSSDEESVANLARSWRRKENKDEMKLDVPEIKNEKESVKRKYTMKVLSNKQKAKILVDRFLSGPEGTLVPIKYKEVVLMKTNQDNGYLAPDGELERFKTLVNEKELYCCEECEFTSEHLKTFNIHFLAHANIHFIQECVGIKPIRVKKEVHVKPIAKVECLDFTSTEVHWETPIESKVLKEDSLYSDGDAHFEDAKQHNPLPDEDLYSAEVKDMLEDDKSLLIKNNDPMQFVSVVNIKKEIKEEDSEAIFKEEESNGDYYFEIPVVNAVGHLDVVDKPPAVVESDCARKVSVSVADKVTVKKKPRVKLERNSGGGVRKAKRSYALKPFLKCDKCEYTSKYRHHIKHHQCRPYFVCRYCHQMCSNRLEYVEHVKSHDCNSIGRLGKLFQCNICCTMFKRRDATKSHIHRKHCDQEKKLCGQDICVNGKVEYECNECGKKFSTKFILARHLDQKHSTGKIYKCNICHLDFNSDYAMKNHKKQHSCLHCAFHSDSLEEVFIHRQSHASEQNQKPMLSCQVCPYQTTNKRRLEGHASKHKVKQPFKCSQCDFTAIQRGNLNIHEKSHIVTDAYSCTLCNFKCHRIEAFSKHKLSHGLDQSTLMMVDPSKRDKRFRYCDKCEYRTKFPQSLKSHLLKHDNIRPYLCADCGASFTSLMNFHSHKKSHAAPKEMYKCSYCNYRYHMKSTVLIHERKHTGKKPHVCDLCNYSTSYAGNLSNHRKKHFTNIIKGGLIKPPKPSLE